MKKSLFILTIILVCLLCAAAGASPVLTDGEATGWIADNNYLFLQTPNGMTAQLSMPIDDLIRFTDEDVKKDSLMVTPIGICLNYYEQSNNFIYVSFNEERIKIYDNGSLAVVDAAMNARPMGQ